MATPTIQTTCVEFSFLTEDGTERKLNVYNHGLGWTVHMTVNTPFGKDDKLIYGRSPEDAFRIWREEFLRIAEALSKLTI